MKRSRAPASAQLRAPSSSSSSSHSFKQGGGRGTQTVKARRAENGKRASTMNSTEEDTLHDSYDDDSQVLIGEEADLDEVEELEEGLELESQGVHDDDEDEFIDDEEILTGAPDETARVGQDKLLKMQWPRKGFDSSAFDPAKESLVFLQMEADYYIGDQKPGYPGPVSGKVPIVRMYGVTRDGHSVLCHTRGYIPYFYLEMPKNFNAIPHLENYREVLNRLMAQNNVKKPKGAENLDYILHVDIVEKEDLMHYSFGKKTKFFRIYTGIPMFVPSCRRVVETGHSLPGFGLWAGKTYESNILFVLRCMIDSEIVGSNWIELPKAKYSVRPVQEMTSHCQIEVDVSHEELISHEPVAEWSVIAPLRILSFDIECAGRDAHFPTPEQDPVIQIANYVTVHGSNAPLIRNVFVLGDCANIVGADVHCFSREEDMLNAWRDFVISVDPDIMTGYNIINFDIPYLLNRARKLKLNKFSQLGRILSARSHIKSTTFSSKAYGTRESKDVNIEGRVQLDLLQVVQRDYKLSSYSLNSVSAHFLSEQKDEVHYTDITKLHNGTPEDRRRLAVYCLKDAYLPQRLLDKLMIIVNYIEMARVTGIPLSFLLRRGQQIKVLSQLLRFARNEDKIMPTTTRKGISQEGYVGATVIEPKTGYYDTPITTLDFASLYPSIMIAHNLCYTTLIKKEDLHRLKPDQYSQTPTGDYFVNDAKCKGLLPRVLVGLLEARSAARKDLKNEKDPAKAAVLNGRQLALKISANSVYGFTGATVGHLPCLEISGSVTAYGREMIEKSLQLVEERYTIKNGYKHDAVVIYGDTDSIMIKFGSNCLEESMQHGREAAAYISSHFKEPIKLEFEKIYYPYLIIAKKRYAGLYWTNAQKYDMLDVKGIETVRRDNCALVRNLISTCLHLILVERSIESAIQYAKGVISDLLMNRLDISMLVITKSMAKKSEDYTAKQAHVELARRMFERDPSTAPHTGDRIPYVIIKGHKGARAYEKSEDPIYVLKNNISIDTQYYLHHQVAKPLMSIFRPIMRNPQSLLHGEHTRNISILTPKTGGIARFAKKKKQCLGCKAAMSDSDSGYLCQHCKPKEAEIYEGLVQKRNYFENIYSRTWTYCQRCQGSLHSEVICANRDCNLFYMREKVKKDLESAQDLVDRFEHLEF